MKHSEEDVKIKVVLQWLEDLGFTKDELEFEKSFSLHLPKATVNIDVESQIKKTSPRLDILVTRNGNNLFIIEVKRDSKNLTEQDKVQAINYARLLRPMAPIAIVTNGKDVEMYKVGDERAIAKDKATILGYKIDLDLERTYQEAFEYFIGLSQENLKIFCEAQVNEGMKTLLGSRERSDKKFIPELYVPSKKYDELLSKSNAKYEASIRSYRRIRQREDMCDVRIGTICFK